MQILHTGRYGYHFSSVSASAIKAPIGWFTPKALSSNEIHATISDFVNTAVLAKVAGYDGVEIMGSEGYLINQFIVKKTNQRSDEWGGPYENRIRLAIEIVKQTRQAVGTDFIIIYRLSMLDLIDDGSSWEEVVQLARSVEAAGATIINTGIGWHEARIPTIATMVPRGAFAWVTKRMKGAGLTVPLCTTNRINTPSTAEHLLADGAADMVSMARPFLADPDFVTKAMQGRADEINTCIGCNQACLDHTFQAKRASCLVNPRAGHETELKIAPVVKGQSLAIAVVGAGPAGLAFATTAAARGHEVTLFEKEADIGGQFNMAKKIPGKEEFNETLRYFRKQIALSGVQLRVNTEVSAADLAAFDAVVVAAGVVPRQVNLPHSGTKVSVLSYVDVLQRGAAVGRSVAVIGAGGIGYDLADFLTHHHPLDPAHSGADDAPAAMDQDAVARFLSDWGVDSTLAKRGGLLGSGEAAREAPRQVYLLQRKAGKLGSGLGKTTGWIHRATAKRRGVQELAGCKYVEVTDAGLVIERQGQRSTLAVDTVVVCAGQESLRDLYEPLSKQGKKVFLIGGAQEAGELDAKRAIDQGTRLAAQVEIAASGAVFEAPQGTMHRLYRFAQGLA